MTSPFTLPYTSTKFALNGFFGSLNHELTMKKSNVSISICTLGLIDTESAMEKVRFVKYVTVLYCVQKGLLGKTSVAVELMSTVTCSVFPYLRGVTKIPAYPATDAALNIVIAGATRQPDLYYPSFTYVVTVIKEMFPSTTNYVIQNSYNYVP